MLGKYKYILRLEDWIAKNGFKGYGPFDLMDWISANMLLPLGGLFISIFIGWFFGRKKVKEEVAKGGSLSGAMLSIFMFLVKFIAPIAIAVVMLNKIGLLNF